MLETLWASILASPWLGYTLAFLASIAASLSAGVVLWSKGRAAAEADCRAAMQKAIGEKTEAINAASVDYRRDGAVSRLRKGNF